MKFVLFSVILVLVTASSAQSGNEVKYHATINDVKYVYGPAQPVARLKPGDVLETNTLDAFGDAIQKPGDTHLYLGIQCWRCYLIRSTSMKVITSSFKI